MLHHNRMPYRRLALMLAAVMLVALISACGNKGAMPGAGKGDVIATYKDGGKVTSKEFDKYVAYTTITNQQKAMYMSFMKEYFVKEYAAGKVLIGELTKEQKKDFDATVKSFRTQLTQARVTQPELKTFMKENDLSVEDVIAFLRYDLAYDKYRQDKLAELEGQVTEEDLKAEFDKAPADFNIVSVRHILIKTYDPQTQQQVREDEEALKIANEVKAKLDAGGDWEALAKEFSEDEGSKDKGGLYEKQQAKGWVSAFKEAANTQEIGKIGEPVKTEYGYHVMKVESRESTAFDKLTDTDKEGLKANVGQAKLTEFLNAEQEKLEIKVTLPEEPSPSPSESGAGEESPSASPDASPSSSPAASPSASPSASE